MGMGGVVFPPVPERWKGRRMERRPPVGEGLGSREELVRGRAGVPKISAVGIKSVKVRAGCRLSLLLFIISFFLAE